MIDIWQERIKYYSIIEWLLRQSVVKITLELSFHGIFLFQYSSIQKLDICNHFL